MKKDINLFKANVLSVIWVIKYYLLFKFFLYHRYGIKNLKIFNFFNWHGGASYFTAKMKNSEVFIKTDWYSWGILQNEKIALEALSVEKENKHFPTVYLYSNLFGNDFLVYEFLNGKSINSLDMNSVGNIEKVVYNIGQQFIDILKVLQRKSFIHRDIRPDNIMILYLNENLLIKIIDFSYCISSKDKHNFIEIDFLPIAEKILSALGEVYKPDEFDWDDSYSLHMIYSELLVKYNIKNNSLKEELKSNIGTNTYSNNI